MPRLLDLFCGAGGAATGYYRAGFDKIVGVDINPQPRYPLEFVQADALEYVAEHGYEFDAIHASPPCQGYSIMRNLPWNKDRAYPLLIEPTEELLNATGKFWVIENVMGAHLPAGWLCGTMFGLPFYRHRAFAGNWFWLQPGHPKHSRREQAGSAVRDSQHRGSAVTENFVHGNGAQSNDVGIGPSTGWRLAAEAMRIDWMKRGELTQAIPPASPEYIGHAVIKPLKG